MKNLFETIICQGEIAFIVSLIVVIVYITSTALKKYNEKMYLLLSDYKFESNKYKKKKDMHIYKMCKYSLVMEMIKTPLIKINKIMNEMFEALKKELQIENLKKIVKK